MTENWLTQYIPIVPQARPRTTGNGSRVSSHGRKFNDLGISYPGGIGCSRHENCFNCPFDECHFLGGDSNDHKFMSNQGDGIKP